MQGGNVLPVGYLLMPWPRCETEGSERAAESGNKDAAAGCSPIIIGFSCSWSPLFNHRSLHTFYSSSIIIRSRAAPLRAFIQESVADSAGVPLHGMSVQKCNPVEPLWVWLPSPTGWKEWPEGGHLYLLPLFLVLVVQPVGHLVTWNQVSKGVMAQIDVKGCSSDGGASFLPRFFFFFFALSHRFQTNR